MVEGSGNTWNWIRSCGNDFVGQDIESISSFANCKGCSENIEVLGLVLDLLGLTAASALANAFPAMQWLALLAASLARRLRNQSGKSWRSARFAVEFFWSFLRGEA